MRKRTGSPIDLKAPALTATRRKPLMLVVDGVTVRAWPALIDRDHPTWAKVYRNPATGDIVRATEELPRWMFEAPGRPPSPGGSVTVEQTRDDVEDLATVWLRAGELPRHD